MTEEQLLTKKSESYYLTPKGEDAVYILLAILRYGIKHFIGMEVQTKLEGEKLARQLHYGKLDLLP
jgi:hypothetical protein